jgi:hypothetical protein
MVEDEQGIQGYWEYRASVLEDAEATALCLQYTALAEIVCAQPDLPLHDIFRLKSERRADQQVRRLQEIRETGSQKIQQVKRRTIIARKEDKHNG